jgi:hypothetical protein
MHEDYAVYGIYIYSKSSEVGKKKKKVDTRVNIYNELELPGYDDR